MLNWILNRVLTGNAQDIHRHLKAHRDAIQELRDAVSELRTSTKGAFERLDELESAHRKLRGRFYQARGAGELAAEPATREERRAQALRAVGYMPGRPVNHQE